MMTLCSYYFQLHQYCSQDMRRRRRAPLWVALAALVVVTRCVTPGLSSPSPRLSIVANMSAEEIASLPVSSLASLTKGLWHTLTPLQVSRLPLRTLGEIPVQAVTLETLASYPPRTFKHSLPPPSQMEANQPSISDQQRILSQFDSDASITPESLLHEGAAAHAMLLQPMRGYWSDWTYVEVAASLRCDFVCLSYFRTWYCDKYFWWQWCGTVAFKRTEALRDKIKKMAARVKQAETE